MEQTPEEDDRNALPVPVAPDVVRELTPGSGSEPYADFQLVESDIADIPQIQALFDDPDIAPYLRHGGSPADSRKRGLKAGIGLVASVAVLLALYLLPHWNMFAGYTPPPVAETPKPISFTGKVPFALQERLKSIHADIADPARSQPAFDQLRTLVADADSNAIELPPELEEWARSELLVAMASRAIDPSSYDEAYPEQIFSGLAELPDRPPGPAFSFRAGAAFTKILHSLPPGKKDAATARENRLLEVVERLRVDYSPLLDKDRELLTIEAECHIAAFPSQYSQKDRHLDYHWRRAAHAIGKLYEQYGKSDAATRSLDKKRWQAVLRYFDLTLFTWDVDRIGWLKSITLDGREYTKQDVQDIVKQL